MKRVVSRFERKLPPVRLFKADLQQILDRLSTDTDVEIIQGNHSYDGLEDLAQHLKREPIRSLEIRGRPKGPLFGSLWITVEPAQVRISADPVLWDRAAGIVEQLRACVKWYSQYPVGSPWWYGLRGILSTTLGIVVGLALPIALGASRGFAFGITAICVALGMWLAFSNRPFIGASAIYLHDRATRPSFWQRNRDIIIVSTITSLITLLLGFVLGRLTK